VSAVSPYLQSCQHYNARQTSFFPAPCFFCWSTRLSHRDTIASIIGSIVSVAFLFDVIAETLFPSCRGECGPLALVPPDIKQLFSNSVFRGKAVLNVRLKESLIRYATLQNIAMMLLVQTHQRFGRDGEGTSLAAGSN
jgi:hypothetical protein